MPKLIPKFEIGDKVVFSVPLRLRTEKSDLYEGKAYRISHIDVRNDFVAYWCIPLKDDGLKGWGQCGIMEEYLIPYKE